jgi:hypothetical protein
VWAAAVRRALVIALSCLLASLVSGRAYAQGKGSEGGSTGTNANGASQTVWRATAREASASQGSSCPWTYIRTTGDDDASDRTTDQIDPATGRMLRLFRDCKGQLFLVLQPTPFDLASELYADLTNTIQPSKIGMQPVDDIGAIVKVDTWYWLETNNTPITKEKRLLGVAAKIETHPTKITTDWGDGNTTTCTAPGTDYGTVKHPSLYRDPDPAPNGCSYRYTTHSGKQPAQKFTVTTTVTWEATWTSGSEGGTFAPITRQTVNQLKVDQIQAILTKP